jgi:hypothetical protein
MSQRDHKRTRRAWRSRKNRDRERIAELDRRELKDLDDCRFVWETHADPLALTFGVAMAEALDTWPSWLVDAVLLALCAEDTALKLGGLRLGPRWKAKRREMDDAKRAAALLAVRNDPGKPEKWLDATATAAQLAADHAGTTRAGAEATRDSYSRTIAGLADEGKYWQAPAEFLTTRLHLALQALPERHRARLVG